jgi:hypothetical protein
MGPEEAERFAELADELEDLYGQHTMGGGYLPEVAARKQHIERILMDALGAQVTEDQRRTHRRVVCELNVVLRHGTTQGNGVVRDLGIGGVYVETAMATGTGGRVEIEVARKPGVFEHGLKVRGVVAWTSGRGFGAMFSPTDEGSERRLRRFVLELLRRRSG